MVTLDGIELKVTRIRAKLAQWEVSAALGYHPSYLSHIEAGRKPCKPEEAARILSSIERLKAEKQQAAS